MNLLQEAIADANKVKELALENAKAAIEEVFSPKIQRIVSAKLAEDEFEDEMLPTDSELDAPGDEEFPPMGENFMDGGEPGDGEIDEEFDKIIRELEPDSEVNEEDDAYDKTVGDSNGNTENVGETPRSLGEGDGTDCPAEDGYEEESLEKMNLESLIRKLQEEEFGKPKTEKVATPARAEDVSALKAEIARLKKENSDAYKAIAEIKSKMNEVNLLNNKLMYASKIIQSFNLSEAQQVKILETFDRAQSPREVKLIYSTIFEHYRGKNTVRKNAKSPKIVESASRTIRTVKGKNPERDSNLMEGADRWQQIAGIKPLKD